MMKDDNTAIDFRKLLSEERKRAKRKQSTSKKATTAKQRAEESPPREECSQSQETKQHDKQEATEFDWSDIELLSSNNVSQTWKLAEHCVSESDPSSVYYVSRFLNPQYSNQLIQWLQGLSNNMSGNDADANGKWTTMRHAKRRVALFDGELPLPLKRITDTLVSLRIFDKHHQPNHVLVNEYTATQGILPHTDGPLYFPKTATISIGGGDVLFKLTPRLATSQITREAANQVVKEVWLEGCGSLVVFCDDAYTNHCHGIDDHVTEEVTSEVCVNAATGTPVHRGYRISLTFRHKY